MSPREPDAGESTAEVESVEQVETGDVAATSVEDERSADDRDEGWGDRSGSGFDDEWYLSQRPPHWD